MGLRLSLDSSESESNGGPTSTSRVYNSYNQSNDRSRNSLPSEAMNSGPTSLDSHRNPTESPTPDIPSHTPDSFSLRDLVRELRSINSDENAVYRLLYPHSTRDNAMSNRSGAYRSYSVSGSADPSSQASTSGSGESYRLHGNRRRAADRNRHRRYRTSCVDLNTATGANRTSGARIDRRGGLMGALAAGRWDSSGSEDEPFDILNNLDLSALLFRHFRSGSSGESQVDHELVRALRLSAARAAYNVDRLTQNSGECTICLEDLVEGDVIARLPCLCVYHKKCIDTWFKRRPVCPVHPGDD